MPVPEPTPILRLIHVDNLQIYLQHGGFHAANFTPQDSLTYRTIHNVEIQQKRRATRIPCGRGSVIHDYVPFYFGYLSPMLFQLKTGRVPGCNEGQEPLIYLVSTAQAVRDTGRDFVFSDGHGLATFMMVNPKYIINFPTKRHWRGASQIADIKAGLQALIEDVRQLGIQSIAVPPLGCGLGGLSWNNVRPLIVEVFKQLPDVRVLLYAPVGVPEAKTMPVRTKAPNMTHARALFIKLMEQYGTLAYRLTLLEVQILTL